MSLIPRLKWTSIQLLILIAILSANLLYPITSSIVLFAQQNNFILTQYTVTSSAGTPYIYPGSRNVVLTIDLLYNNSLANASNVFVCLDTPSGIHVVNDRCSDIVPQISYGEKVRFTFYLSIDENVSPNTYTIEVQVNYVLSNTMMREYKVINITVYRYPQPVIEIEDCWWSSQSYKGSTSAELNIVLRNRGNVTIAEGHGILILYSEYIDPNTTRVDIPLVRPNETTTITVRGLYIAPEAPDNVTMYLVLNVTAETGDGVTYSWDNIELNTTVSIPKAPPIKLELLDYGLSAVKYINGSIATRTYFTFIVKSDVTIHTVVAHINVYNATFINGSQTSITYLYGPYAYGDIINIISDPLLIPQNTSKIMITAKLNITIIATVDGSNIWTQLFIEKSFTLKPDNISLYIDAVYWRNSVAYPGSENQELVVVFKNLDVVDLIDATLCLDLPQPYLKPSRLCISNIDIRHASRVSVVFRGIDIVNGTPPGTYVAKLVLKAIVREDDGSYTDYEMLFNVSIPIEDPQKFMKDAITVLDYGWIGGRAYVKTMSAGITISLQIVKPIDVEVLNIRLCLDKDQARFMNGSECTLRVIEGPYSYGSTIHVSFEDIEIYADNEKVMAFLSITMLARYKDAEAWIRVYRVLEMTVLEPELNISILDCHWSAYTLPGTRGASLYITLQSLSIDVIRELYAKLVIVRGGIFSNGLRYTVVHIGREIGYSNVFSLTFNDIILYENASSLTFKLELFAVSSLAQSVYTSSREFVFSVSVSEELSNILILYAVQTLYNGVPVPLLPNARDIVIEIRLANKGPFTITSMSIKNISLKYYNGTDVPQNEFLVVGISGNCFNGMLPGRVCSLYVHPYIGNLSPRLYLLHIDLEYIVEVSNSISKLNASIEIPLTIQNPKDFIPSVTPVSWYWGSTNPVIVFGNTSLTPITVEFINLGRYPVKGVEVSVENLSRGKVVKGTSVCAYTLQPGTTCRATLYIDLRNVYAVNNSVPIDFNISLRYVFDSFGTHILHYRTFHIRLYVEKFSSIRSKGLALIDASWLNRWPVYPNTQNATLTLTFANLLPYSVSAIRIRLIAPQGFTVHEFEKYVSGPIPRYETLTVSFTVDVENISSGIYVFKVLVEYTIESGGTNVNSVDEYEFRVRVHNIENSIEFIATTWAAYSPEPESYGVSLILMFRNNAFPSLKGVYLEVSFPPNTMVCSLNNQSRAKVPPISASQLELLSKYIPKSVSSILSSLPTQTQTLSIGDFIVFWIPVNLLVEKPGTVYISVSLNFIDHWNNVRRILFEYIPVTVFGSTRLVQVYADSKVEFTNGYANFTVYLRNIGSAPIYNVYVYIVPKTPLAIPSENVFYIPVLYPDKLYKVNTTLIYNPIRVSMGIGSQYISYSSIVMLVGIMYKDVLGYTHTFNTTVSSIIEPFIDIRLADTKAEIRGSTIIVSGTILNYGIATARNVEVMAIASNISKSTFIGDVDPSAQIAFRIELRNVHANRITLVISYVDDYGATHSKKYILNVFRISSTTYTVTTSTARSPPFESFKVISIALVGAFLFTIALAIIKFLKRFSIHTLRSVH